MAEEQKKILVIEDDTPIRGAYTNKLTEEGFEVIEAVNGQEGIDKALSEHPDIILADILMPNMSGIEMIKQIREDEWGKTAHIIVLTNLSTEEGGEKTEAESYNVDAFLIKSNVSISAVVDHIKNI